MSVDTNQLQRTASPLGSGRSSPINLRIRNKDEEVLIRKDKGYRRYASGVERALSLFDSALQEWADYISFLGRLLKALQAKPAGSTDIPHKAIIARRLAQCLSPVLPSGVHQKTLEVYAYVFSSIGRDGLARDLSHYLPGLTPTLSFASLSVKPGILSLFETHILALDPKTLRPALKAVILALLPGLEESTSEEFERTLSLLNAFRDVMAREERVFAGHIDSSGDQYFWQCLFLASITSTIRRPGALAYLNRELPLLGLASSTGDVSQERNNDIKGQGERVHLPQAVEAVTSPEPGLLIRCFCAGLYDEQLLVQRGFLDLLVTHLPLHSLVLRHTVVREDLERLVTAASSVVARREMSLNRRLWNWFLGPEPLAEGHKDSVTDLESGDTDGLNTAVPSRVSTQSSYFLQYGLDPLARSIQIMINNQSENLVDKVRPFRICLSLMDRWEIGGLVIPQVFLPAMNSVWRYQSVAPSKESFADVLRSAKVFFDGVESGLIWSEITKIIFRSLRVEEKDVSSAHELLELVLFMITNFNIREEEMMVVHMPTASLVLLHYAHRLLLKQDMHPRDDQTVLIQLALTISNRLLDLVPERAFAVDPTDEATLPNRDSDEFLAQDNIVLTRIERFYTNYHGNLDLENPPVTAKCLGNLLMSNTCRLIASGLRAHHQYTIQFGVANSILETMIRKAPHTAKFDLEDFSSSLTHLSEKLERQDDNHPPFAIIAATISVLETVCMSPQSKDWLPVDLVRQLIPKLITGIWHSLSPSKPKYNVEAVQCVWRLQVISPDGQLVESSVATLVSGSQTNISDTTLNLEGARRFTTLWTHSPFTSVAAQERRSSLIRVVKEVDKQDQKSTYSISILERPLLLLIDTLEDPKSELFVFVVGWLQSLSSVNIIMDLLIGRLQELQAKAERISTPSKSVRSHPEIDSIGSDDLELYLYYLRSISNLTQYSTRNVWSSLAGPIIFEGNAEHGMSNQVFLANTCLELLGRRLFGSATANTMDPVINQVAVSLLQQLLSGPSSTSLADMEIEAPLLEELASSIERADCSLQISLMDLVFVALRTRMSSLEADQALGRYSTMTRDTLTSPSRLSLSIDNSDRKSLSLAPPLLPPKLLQCMKAGLTSRGSRPVLDNWVAFIDHCLPFYANNIFQILLPLVECFCSTLLSVFGSVQATFGDVEDNTPDILEPTLASLLNGLEQILARAHDRLVNIEINTTAPKSPEPQGSFFGSMVSGVFTSDIHRTWTTTANNRLTVLLCFKDAVRVCFTIWSWGNYGADSSLRDPMASASFNYTTSRLRNRTRRIFEHLFAAEVLECVETMVELWSKSEEDGNSTISTTIFNLLHVLDGSRPRNAIPAIFNAMYSRTSPNAIDPVRKSTLTSTLSDTCLATFLIAYVRSLDDDAMDEIWNDSVTFLRDVLANPMPHRQTLPRLLEFTATLGEKVDNTNFGEQRRMRRELGDLFIRLLTADLTTRPMGFSHEVPQQATGDKATVVANSTQLSIDARRATDADDIVAILATIMPNISKVLIDSDRITAIATVLSTQVLAPTLRSKYFPENITRRTLDLLYSMSSIPQASKSWKKDVAEAFNEPKFFATALDLVEAGWMPILRQWILTDKDRMTEVLLRLSSPTSAGIVFGVGASSARLEADRKTQLNLRRIATLILAAADDTFVVNLTGIQEKLVDIMTATATSSPSSATRSEIYMILRALVLKTSPIHLSSLWPTINSELHDAIHSLFLEGSQDTYKIHSVLQACKLLDTLLTIAPDDFQMQEWLFITDTIDAVYRPSDWNPSSLVDELAEGLDTDAGDTHPSSTLFVNSAQSSKRRPMLNSGLLEHVQKEDIMDKVLRPFFRQLSIFTFESTYSMKPPDLKACRDDLMTDLFDDSSLV